MIEDFRSYVEEYYKNMNSIEIDRLENICHSNNYLLKFLILTMKSDISIITENKNKENTVWKIKKKKQLLNHIHQKRRQIIKDYGKKIGQCGLVKNYDENTEKLMEKINNNYLTMIKNINIIDKILKYLTDPKYNIEYSLEILGRHEFLNSYKYNIYIEEYSNSPHSPDYKNYDKT